MQPPSPGQRWISTSEPSLGLGIVTAFDGRRLKIHYPAAEISRTYAWESAPVVRVTFSPGDLISDRHGGSFPIERVSSRDGLLTYHGAGTHLLESAVLDSAGFIHPEKRLLAGLADPPREFDMRLQALDWNARIRQSPARGFTGARIDLLPHQLAIVAECAARLHPRILLADEVGLGKTIEACLILHHLHQCGRAARILILVPEPLIHQWFIELLRRFNLLFAIFDQDRCLSLEAHDPQGNPFLDSQLILAASGFLTNNPQRTEQARLAGFDLLIVDEAHHLEWSPHQVSADYFMVESLALEIPSLLLLTATPQQLGPAGHFARLRLLDPARYADLDAFLEETRSYGPLAGVVEALLQGDLPENIATYTARSPHLANLLDRVRAVNPSHTDNLDHAIPEPEITQQKAKLPVSRDPEARAALIAGLIDSFGTGRVLFRNTRARLRGFPQRQPHLYPLAGKASPYRWLAGLLRSLPQNDKILLITGTPQAAITVQQKLLEIIQVESALFHEDLSLLQRDRNAAWFADPEGARILICSEIGSEGRNFQFARHLVLFGLPRDPELLEQRIGRLDRIGQTGTIHIHVPYGLHSQSEWHARWLHEGLEAFSRPLQGAATLAADLLPRLDALTPDDTKGFDAFLQHSRERKDQVARELVDGHDRLLELGAPPPEHARHLIQAIETADHDLRFERFAVRLFDHLGLEVADLARRTYHFARGHRHSEAFADLPEDGLSGTFERKTALAREDLAFLTADHPLLLDALGHFLASESGNASFAHWKNAGAKAILLECAFLLDVPAPGRLHLERFLPPTTLRITVDHHGKPFADPIPSALLVAGEPRRLVTQESFRRTIFPLMLASANALAQAAAATPHRTAQQLAATTLDAEITRLHDLASRNPQVAQCEVSALRHTRDESLRTLTQPRLRLDAIRLIWCTPH